MDKAVAATKTEFNTVRSGRASTALLDRIHVDYYGISTPLKQIANVAAPEPRLITIPPYDKSSMKAIEKAIIESDLGPQPEQRRRRDPAADPGAHRGAPPRARQAGAPARRRRPRGRAQRPPRRHEGPEGLKNEGLIGEDAERRAEEQLQHLTDERTHEIDELLKHKEAEILEV